VLDEDVSGVAVNRSGYAKYNATALPNAKSVRGLWPFDATDGTKYIIAFSSAAFYKSSGDGTWTAISGLSGFSSSKDFDCTQTIGKFWCANGDVVFWFDGSSTATVSTAPLGTKIGRFRNRVLMAGISGQAARLRLSGELDGTDWSTGAVLSTSPANIAVGGVDDGQNITCLMGSFQDVYLIGKLDSLWGLYGFSRSDFELREISEEVGCLEPRSVQEKNNCKYWLSKRGLEKFCGATIERVSDPIRDQIDTIITTAGNTRTALDTTQADFQAGNSAASGPAARMSTTIVPNAVVPSSWSVAGVDADYSSGTAVNVDSYTVPGQITLQQAFANAGFQDGTFTNWNAVGGGWTVDNAHACTPGVAPVAFLNTGFTFPGQFQILDGVTGAVLQSRTMALGSSCSTMGMDVSTITLSGTTIKMRVTDGTNSLTTTAFSRPFGKVTMGAAKVGSVGIMIDNPEPYYLSSGTWVSRVYDTSFDTPTWGPWTLSVSSNGATTQIDMQVQVAPAVTGPFTSSTNPAIGERFTGNAQRFARFQATFQTASVAVTPTLSTFGLQSATTGYFIGQCRSPGANITSWGLFTCNTVANGGSFSFAISTGSSCDSVTRATATWNSQTNATVISVATSSVVAYRALFSIDAGTQTPTLQDCTINWNEGATRPPVASSVYRDRYYLAYTSSTASGAANDHELVLDRNDKWTLFDDHNCYSLSLYNRKLYCGASTSSGQVWQQDVGTDDDGSAFTSRIRTKAFDLGMPERRKTFSRLYVDLSPAPDLSSVITLTGRYVLDRSTSAFSFGTMNLNEDPGTIQTAKFPFTLSQKTDGRFIQLELESSGKNQPWRLFGGRLYFTPLTPE
jgi:hypothetical protein